MDDNYITQIRFRMQFSSLKSYANGALVIDKVLVTFRYNRETKSDDVNTLL